MATDRIVAGAFRSEGEIVAAAHAARKAGLAVHDAHTPFFVHELDHALGLAPSHLPKICFRFGAAGLLLALGFQYWVSLFDWPMNIGGKSADASPALVPVMFELTVLFAGLGSFFWFLRMRRLSPLRRARLTSLGGVDDRFVLVLRGEGSRSEVDELRRFLEKQGAREVREEALHP